MDKEVESKRQIKCDYCQKLVNNLNHLLECEMVLSYLFNGCLSLSCPEETITDLVTCSRKPNELPSCRWMTILEFREEILKISNPPNNAMYNKGGERLIYSITT